jgi:outer membrane protein TolC
MSVARWLACCVLVIAFGVLAADDDPRRAPSRFREIPRQWQPMRDSPALHVPSPITRDEQVERVSLKEAIALALQNNPGIAAQRLEPIGQDGAVLEAQGIFDPTFAGEVSQRHLTTPNTSALAGTLTSKVDERSANFHLFKTFRSGTVATIDFLNERLDTNARFQQLRPQYRPELNFSLIQPLLQNFGWNFTYLVVRVAEETADAARYTYEAQLTDFVGTVIVAYWDVVRARENLEVQRESRELAVRTVEENEARVRVGLLPPVATLEARADAASREEQVLIAENDLAVARQRLAQLAFYRPADTFVPRTLEPTEEAEPENVKPDLDDTLEIALAERPEVHASARGVSAQELNFRIAGNALLPRLDMVGSYGVNGTSGNSRPIISNTNIGGGNCVPNNAQPGTFICNSGFAGSPSTAYDRLTSNDFRSYSFGLQFQVPLSNAAARGRYVQSRISRDQAELNHRNLLSNVTFEAREAVSDVLTSRQRIDTSRVARELAEENLRNQTRRHEVGMATTKDLLDFQTRLTSARAAEVQAKTDHAISVARWYRAMGRLLERYQIMVDQPGRSAVPWFARF